jgi:hypothetical protein
MKVVEGSREAALHQFRRSVIAGIALTALSLFQK